jgi:hypothetical protein
MSATLAATATATSPVTATLRELALKDAKRFARHPLFIVGFLADLVLSVPVMLSREPDPLASITIMQAFFIGVFGFVVAHRLGTSWRRTDELVGSLPSSQRLRTLALCLACGVPLLAGVISLAEKLLLNHLFPAIPVPLDAPMAWYGDYSWFTVTAALLAMGLVATVGGPLLGVVVATWAPFRGSALVGVVLLLAVTSTMASGPGVPWRGMPPWVALDDEKAIHGNVISATFVPHLSPGWNLLYTLLLCALCVVVALLRDPRERRRLLWAAGALSAAAAAALALSVR